MDKCRHTNCIEVTIENIRLLFCKDCLYCLTYHRELSKLELNYLQNVLKGR